MSDRPVTSPPAPPPAPSPVKVEEAEKADRHASWVLGLVLFLCALVAIGFIVNIPASWNAQDNTQKLVTADELAQCRSTLATNESFALQALNDALADLDVVTSIALQATATDDDDLFAQALARANELRAQIGGADLGDPKPAPGTLRWEYAEASTQRKHGAELAEHDRSAFLRYCAAL